MKLKKEPNPYAKKIVLTFRVNSMEMKTFLEKAHTYTGGDISKWVRHAALKYSPKKSELENEKDTR